MNRFHCPDATAATTSVALPPDEAHHLRHVLRLRAGAQVGVFDGRGCEFRARVASVERDDVTLADLTPVPALPEPLVRVTLAIGLLKGDQMDAVVRDATVAGAVEIVPVVTEHVDVAKPARAGAVARWTRVAIASAKQCGRAVVPIVAPVVAFETAVSRPAAVRLICVEPSARAGREVQPIGALGDASRPVSALCLIGPEGGWTPDEVAAALARGARPVHLGPRTLRAEAMPLALLSSLWAIWE